MHVFDSFWLLSSGTLFLLFFRFQNSKKKVPLPGQCMFLTHFDCFPRVHFFYYLSDFKIVKKVYSYQENACFWLILTVFLGYIFVYDFSDFKIVKKSTFTRKMHVFDSFWLFSSGTSFLRFFRFQNSKKSVLLPGKCMFLTHFDGFPRVHFCLRFFRFQNSKKRRILAGKCMFLTHFDCFPRVHRFLRFFRFQNR